jgi:transcriptional regulator with XRE-family HTH domain
MSRAAGNTEGHRLLRVFLEKHTQTELAKLVGIRQQRISGWVRGISRPENAELRALLEAVCDIPADAWRTAKEKLSFARAMKRTGTDG